MKKIKTTIFDYIKWRGDLTFSQDSFNDVDAMIFCQIGYLPFEEICNSSFSKTQTLKEIKEKFLSKKEIEDKTKNIGLLLNEKISQIFFEIAESERFKNVKICGFKNKIQNKTSLEKQEQFAAMTFIIEENSKNEENEICVVFRGTDDSIVGWKEDCNLGQMDEIPAQKDALSYLKDVFYNFDIFDKKVIIAGHSKGGNLAIYSSAKIDSTKKEKLKTIYNFDGPGFSKNQLDSQDFLSIKDKIKSWYPEESIVGMLFEHYKNYKVVKSLSSSISQHDISSWVIQGKKPVEAESLSNASRFMNDVFNNWFRNLSSEDKKVFIDSLFAIFESSDSTTLSELLGNGIKNSAKNTVTMIKTAQKIMKDDEQSKILKEIRNQFIKIGMEKLKDEGKKIFIEEK